jgi:hypothetical protein
MTDRGGFRVPPIGAQAGRANETHQQTWDSLVFALLYPVLFEQEPMRHVDRVIQAVVAPRALGASPEDYRRAIADGRVSGRALADVFAGLLGLAHSEETMWGFLNAIEERLIALPS